MRPQLTRTAPLAAAMVLALAACSSPSAPTTGPGSTTVPPAATGAGQPTSAAVAGEPCSFLTSEQVTAIVGTAPVEIKERAGRGDCDYWLTAAKDAKISIGVFSGPDDTTLFEGTKAIGDPQPVLNVGDDAYSISTQDLGTIVVAKQGEATIIVQVLTADTADQLRQATELAKAVIANL